MVYKTYSEVKRAGFVPYQDIWACHFESTSDKEEQRYIQKPVLGQVTYGNTEASDKETVSKHPDWKVSYFVPYKKNGHGLAWSKAVQISSRRYATTEEECIQLFNSLVDEEISNLEYRINQLNSYKI